MRTQAAIAATAVLLLSGCEAADPQPDDSEGVDQTERVEDSSKTDDGGS